MESTPVPDTSTQGDANPDLDAQNMVIESLRSQVNDLYSQVTQLNGKLVKSYNHVSDLEDDLHITSDKLKSSTLKISELEIEKTQHLSALNTGLLVEKSQVTLELSRLMEKATEEAAQRGQAESARQQIEKELDDLAATLFEKANSMVAEARFAQSQSETKVSVAQEALNGAEEAVSMMQSQMQNLQAQMERAEREAETAKSIMEKGKWVDKSINDNQSVGPVRRLMGTHLPYQEFLLFIAHLRSAHSASPQSQPPTMSTLLSLPFLARILAEDSEPTVRLDLAPSLNWLSRRSVLTAIHHNQLTIEPMSSHTLLLENSQSQSPLPGFNNSTNTICCALCGACILTLPDVRQRTLSNTLSRATTSMSSAGWFKNPLSQTAHTSPTSTPPLQKPQNINDIPSQVHIFRLSSATSVPTNGPAVPSAFSFSVSPSLQPSTSAHLTPMLPSSTQASPAQPKPFAIYPLCSDGWCLARLRTTCSLWAFVRTGIVERVWEEEVLNLSIPSQHGASALADHNAPPSPQKQTAPPRKRGIWGMASALSERAASWKGDTDQEKDKKLPPTPIVAPTPKMSSEVPVQMPPPLPKRDSIQESNSPSSPVFTTLPLGKDSSMDDGVETSHSIFDATSPESVPAPLPAASPPPIVSPKAAARPLSSSVLENEAAKIAELTGNRSSGIRSRPTSGIINDLPPRTTTPPPRPPRGVPRPTSPRAIPLPESQPTTPMHSQFPITGPVEGAPPPVPPRRAARRPRPVSAAGIPAPPSRSATPVPSNMAEDPIVAEESDQAPSTTLQNTKPKDADVLSEPKETVKIEEAVVPKASEQPPSISPPFEKSTEAVNDTTKDDTSNQTTNEVVVIANSAVDEPQSTSEQDKSGEENKISENNYADEDAHATYIGNATWEERTWKELVRLRQEMFWARVGCIYT